MSVKSFSGATVDDKPTIRKHPDKLVIHAGTNDVRSSSPRTIANKVTELAEQFKQESNHTRIIIPSLVTRNDSQELPRKVKKTNIILKKNS
jgi:lysophospholipase L1-like esterase